MLFRSIIKPRKTALILGNQLRVEAAMPVAGHVDLELAGVRRHRLAAVTVAAIASLLIVAQMMIHLGIERPFGQRFLQRIEHSALKIGSASCRERVCQYV